MMSLHVPPLVHAHVLHPWPVYPPRHTQLIKLVTESNKHVPLAAGHVPAAHVAATHTPPTPVLAYPSSHAQVLSSDPTAGGHVPLPPQSTACAESGSAAKEGGPAPGQNK